MHWPWMGKQVHARTAGSTAAPAMRAREEELWDEAQDILNSACEEGLGRDTFELTYPRAMNAVMDALARYKPQN